MKCELGGFRELGAGVYCGWIHELSVGQARGLSAG